MSEANILKTNYELLYLKTNNECIFNDSIILKLKIKNLSNDSIFIAGLIDYIYTGEQLPLHENYGDYENFVISRKNVAKEYFKYSINSSNRIENELVEINFPYLCYGSNDSCYTQIVDKFFELSNLYEAIQFSCNFNQNSVPYPPVDINTYLNDEEYQQKLALLNSLTLNGSLSKEEFADHITLLNPNEEKIIEYNITPFILDSVNYKLNYKIGKNSIIEEINKYNKIGNYIKFENKTIFNKEILVQRPN